MIKLFHSKLLLLILFTFFSSNLGFACNITSVFTPSNNSPVMGDHVTFTNNSSRAATSFQWQVDGITVSTDRNYIHYFNGVGTFNIKLIASDGRSCSSVYSKNFDVEREIVVTDRDLSNSSMQPEVFDRFGNQFTLEDIKIPDNTWNAGIFVLHFDDETPPVTNIGFNHPTLGASRRNVLIQVFEDLSALLTSGLPTPYNNLNMKVEIRISTNTNLASNGPLLFGSSIAGMGTSYYVDYGSPGLTHGAVWQTITSGVSPYHGMSNIFLLPQGVANQGTYFHGRMSFNFLSTSNPIPDPNHPNWYLDLTAASSVAFNELDLYTVALHEAMHVLGFSSAIGSTGNSALSNGSYSTYDTFLTFNGFPLITSNTNCYDHLSLAPTLPSILTQFCPGIKYSGNGTNNSNHDVFVTNPWEQGSSLQHFNCSTTNGYVMNASGIGGSASVQRIPHISEIETLCDLGYDIQPNYGNGAYAASSTTGNPYANSCSNTTLAGVNDRRYYNSSSITAGSLFTVTSAPSNIISLSSNDILGNDFGGPNEISCLEIVIGPGSNIVNITPSSFDFDPSDYWQGEAILRYRPYNSNTDTYGNVTYIYIKVNAIEPPCNNNINQTCNMVCNGDFEIYACGTPNTCKLSYAINDFRLSNNPGVNTPDVYGYSTNGNDAFIFLNDAATNPEAIFLPLDGTIDPGCTIDISFDASSTNGVTPTLVILGATTAPCPSSVVAGAQGTCGTALPSCPGFTPLCPAIVNTPITNSIQYNGWVPMYDFNPQFQNYSFTWTNNGPAISGILITTGNTNTGKGIYIDNVVIENQCETPVDVTVSASSTTPCLGDQISVEYEVCLPPGYPANSSNINLSALIPSQGLVSVIPNGDFNSLGEAIIPSGALTPSSPCINLTLNLNILQTAPAGIPFTLDLVSDGSACLNQGNNSIDITPGIALNITKTASAGPYFPGSIMNYIITVENPNPFQGVTNVQIQDALPPNLSASLIFGYWTQNGQTLTSTLFDLPPGQSQSFNMILEINPAMSCGNITNCATIIGGDGVCNILGNSCETIYVNANIPIPQASADVTYCQGEIMADLTSSPPASNGTLLWFYDTGNGFTYIGSGSSMSPQYTSVGTHTYIVMEVVGGFFGCGSVPDTVNVTITPADWQQVAGNNSNENEQGEDVQVDNLGNVYVTGACGNDAVFGGSSNQMSINGEGFIAKYNPCGRLLWVRQIKKPGKALVLNLSETNIIVTGGGQDNAFLTSYDQNGNQNWYENIFTAYQGSEIAGTSIDIDQNDRIYFTGYYYRSIQFGGLSGSPVLYANNLARHGFVATYGSNGQHINAVNLTTNSQSGEVYPRGIAVTFSPAPMQVYVGGSYSGQVSLSGQQMSGNGEFIVGLTSPGLMGLVSNNISSAYGWSISPLSELDWDDNNNELLATGGNMVVSLSPIITQGSFAYSTNTTTRLVDIDYQEAQGWIYVCGQGNSNQEALVARVKPNAGFQWISTASNPGGSDISKGVASNGVGNNEFNVHTTGGYVSSITFQNASFLANGNTSDIFMARLKDDANTGVFYKTNLNGESSKTEESKIDVSIYPNPFTETFWVDLSKLDENDIVTIEVMDVTGKLLLQKKDVNGGSINELNLNQVDDGMYIVRVIQNDTYFMQKLIKQ